MQQAITRSAPTADTEVGIEVAADAGVTGRRFGSLSGSDRCMAAANAPEPGQNMGSDLALYWWAIEDLNL